MCIAVGVYTYQQQTMMDFSNAITQILVAFFVESVDEQAFDAFQAIMSPTLYRETIDSIKKRLGPKEVFSEEQKERFWSWQHNRRRQQKENSRKVWTILRLALCRYVCMCFFFPVISFEIAV
jgi:hypothetical protein